MINPIEYFRKKMNLSRREFALLTGVGYAELWRSESGYARSLHPQLVQFLKKYGYDGDPETDYAAWRRKIGEEIRETRIEHKASIDKPPL